MRFVDRAYNNLMTNENKFIQEILIKRSNYMKKLHRISIYFLNTFVFFVAMSPFFEKHLVMQLELPGVKKNFVKFNTIGFWLLYIQQTILDYFAMSAFLLYMRIIINFIYFSTTLLEILRYKIKSLGILEESNESETDEVKDLKEEILNCIKMHLEIKEFCNSLNNLLANVIFAETFIVAVNLSFIIFAYQFATSAVLIMLYSLVVVYNTSSIFILCLYGDHLTNEVLAIQLSLIFFFLK